MQKRANQGVMISIFWESVEFLLPSPFPRPILATEYKREKKERKTERQSIYGCPL